MFCFFLLEERHIIHYFSLTLLGKVVFHSKNNNEDHIILLLPSSYLPMELKSSLVRQFVVKYPNFFPVNLEKFLYQIGKIHCLKSKLNYLTIYTHLYHYPTVTLFKLILDKIPEEEKILLFFSHGKSRKLSRINWFLVVIPMVFAYQNNMDKQLLKQQRRKFLLNLFLQILTILCIIYILKRIPIIIKNLFFS